MSFNDLRDFYKDHFTLGYLGGSHGHNSIESRFILISLINHVYSKAKLKNPDLTRWELIMKLGKNKGLPEEFCKGLAIVCEDFAYQCNEFPTFGLKGNDIIKEIQYIFDSYLPF